MLELALYGLLAILVAGGLFLAASFLLPAGEQIAPPLRDDPPWSLPQERTIAPEDVDRVRLPVALRGYRFAETDLLLDRLAGELRARDAEIARLRNGRPSPRTVASEEPPPGDGLTPRVEPADPPQPPPPDDDERPVEDVPQR